MDKLICFPRPLLGPEGGWWPQKGRRGLNKSGVQKNTRAEVLADPPSAACGAAGQAHCGAPGGNALRAPGPPAGRVERGGVKTLIHVPWPLWGPEGVAAKGHRGVNKSGVQKTPVRRGWGTYPARRAARRGKPTAGRLAETLFARQGRLRGAWSAAE